MANITKAIDRLVPVQERCQVFTGSDAVQGDILLIRGSLGKSARQMVLNNTSIGDMSLRFNVRHIQYPSRGPNTGLHWNQGMRNVSLPTDVIIESMTPVVVEAGTSFSLQNDIPVNDIQLVGASGAGVSTEVFTGTGLDDATSGGTYSGTVLKNYVVRIDATGTPDTFEWSDDGGATFGTTGVSIVGGAMALELGVTVTFAATTGHTVGDQWAFTGGTGATFDFFVS